MNEKPQQDQQVESDLQTASPISVWPTISNKLNGISKWLILISIPLVIAVVFIWTYFGYKILIDKPEITTFEECVKANGGSIPAIYPATCVTKDGVIFKEEIEGTIIGGPTEALECYEQITNDQCPAGADCMQTVPEETFCNCMGGSLELIVGCVIDEELYTGITYQDFEQGWYFGNSDERKIGTPDNWVHIGEGTRDAKWTGRRTETSTYTLEKSEGYCSSDTLCVWAGDSCGGGHGICTNNPQKYENNVTTCEVDESFPANLGYTCGCVETVGMCGWLK